MNIYLSFKASQTFLGKVIRFLTRSDVNHVAIEYQSEDYDDMWLIEAAFNGVICKPSVDRYKYTFLLRYDAEAELKAAASYIGERYDYRGLFFFAFILIAWNFFKIKLRKPFTSSKGKICSELASYFINGRVEIENPQWISPDDLLKICLSRPDLFQNVNPELNDQ
jgi:hypothetical protein